MKSPANSTLSDNFVMMRYGKDITEMDRSFDIEFWQRQGDAAIFRGTWELIEFYLRQNKNLDGRLQRTVEHFQRERS